MARLLEAQEIGAQLYTLRDFTNTREDLRETLERVAEIGYTGVQLSMVDALFGSSPSVEAAEVKDWLDELDLVCSATHRPLEKLEQEFDAEVALHETLDCQYVAIGSLPWSMKGNLDGAEAFLDSFNELAKRYRDAGIDLGIHNHDWDAAFLAEHLPGTDIQWEMDIYWADLGGVALMPTIAELEGHLTAVHLKDMPQAVRDGQQVSDDERFAAVGEGVLRWPAIITALRTAGTEIFLVEQDHCPRDPFDCMDSSFKYLRARA